MSIMNINYHAIGRHAEALTMLTRNQRTMSQQLSDLAFFAERFSDVANDISISDIDQMDRALADLRTGIKARDNLRQLMSELEALEPEIAKLKL